MVVIRVVGNRYSNGIRHTHSRNVPGVDPLMDADGYIHFQLAGRL